MPSERKEEKMEGKKKKRVVLFSIVGVIPLVAIILLVVYFFAPKSSPKYIAHRGYSQKYPDNTEAAFAAAAGMNFYGIETDVQKTADGVYVCNHDETAKYKDGDEKKISTSTYAELVSKPLKNDKTSEDAYICTFERYLEICKSGKKVAVIELKEDFGAEEVGEILAIVDATYDRRSVSVISFYLGALLHVKAIDPSVNLQYLSETKNDPNFDRCIEEKISIDVRQTILTSKLVKKFHKAGLTVNVWTVNKKFDRSIVRLKGVDYITTNVFDGD